MNNLFYLQLSILVQKPIMDHTQAHLQNAILKGFDLHTCSFFSTSFTFILLNPLEGPFMSI